MLTLTNQYNDKKLQITPTRNRIIFRFLDASTRIDRKAAFEERTAGGIIYKNYEKTVSDPRWGVVLAVGPDVIDDIKVGMNIFIESLGWTTAYKLNNSDPVWFTEDSRVIGVEA